MGMKIKHALASYSAKLARTLIAIFERKTMPHSLPPGVSPADLKQEPREEGQGINSNAAATLQEFEQKVVSCCLEMVIHAWRAERRMKDRATGEVRDEYRLVYRNIAGIQESLSAMGFHVKDREGEAYDYGLPEKVVAAEKRAGLSREIVTETIRPSVFFRDQLVREGEIIIAVPDDAAPSSPGQS